MTSLFPMFVKLAGRKCLVVGGGPIAEGKVEGLLASGASVVVIAPEVTDKIARWKDQGRLTWHVRHFQPSDLEGALLVVTATGLPAVSESVFREADARGILCNAVDEPERCHFYYPAIVRRGPLQIAISTAGLSPALAGRLRAELEAQFGPEYERWLQKLGAMRRALFARRIDPRRRTRVLQLLASRKSFERFLRLEKRRTGGSA
ncbi:MAG TPA: bifunctional precorrin-2 dehydrogenase/sirohydrochlorin ferrochelatase [Terriglobales bacterium]|nr:bifunctional precorrin-2 dehydrogenase/sirohydrochlorin ferrochelatase [Terriglobales bacterium]